MSANHIAEFKRIDQSQAWNQLPKTPLIAETDTLKTIYFERRIISIVQHMFCMPNPINITNFKKHQKDNVFQ